MALVVVMTMAQCKKNNPTIPDNLNNVVTITLDVKNNNGSRVDVNTTSGTVDFETGDKVYVGSGGKYVGFLTHNGTNFVGNITNPTENQPLQFYFLGNVMPTETLSAGTTEECSVIISDQTEHLPVISCAASNENYVSGLTSYTGHLLNKCALVKFIVTTPSNSPICITGMKNKVTVDFTQNTMTPSMDGNGVIMLPAGSGENVEKWAILLPQEALEEGEEGSVYSEDGVYSGVRPKIPSIIENGYLAEGVNVVELIQFYVDLGLPSGLLWATCNVGANAPEEYGNYFAWGETTQKNWYDWNTYQYCMGSNNTLTKYCNNTNYGYNGFADNLTSLSLEDDAATVNWEADWRMPTNEDWYELQHSTTYVWTTHNGVNGMRFIGPNGNSIFLPAADLRDGNIGNNNSNFGYYWSGSLFSGRPDLAIRFYIQHNGVCGRSDDLRFRGLSVRAVRSKLQN